MTRLKSFLVSTLSYRVNKILAENWQHISLIMTSFATTCHLSIAIKVQMSTWGSNPDNLLPRATAPPLRHS